MSNTNKSDIHLLSFVLNYNVGQFLMSIYIHILSFYFHASSTSFSFWLNFRSKVFLKRLYALQLCYWHDNASRGVYQPQTEIRSPRPTFYDLPTSFSFDLNLARNFFPKALFALQWCHLTLWCIYIKEECASFLQTVCYRNPHFKLQTFG